MALRKQPIHQAPEEANVLFLQETQVTKEDEHYLNLLELGHVCPSYILKMKRKRCSAVMK